jgi:hypothetical protein
MLNRRKGMKEEKYFDYIERLNQLESSRGDHIDRFVIARHEKYLLKWDRIRRSLSLLVISLLIVAFNPQLTSTSYTVEQDRPYVIKVSVSPVYEKAEIQLPPGLEFYSNTFPEISLLANLNLDLDRVNKNELSFVIRGQDLGRHSIGLKLSGEKNTSFHYIQVHVDK